MVYSTVGIKRIVKLWWHDNSSNLFVIKAVPETIWCNNESFIVLSKAVEHLYLRLTSNSHTCRHKITYRTSHRKPRNLLVFKPNSLRSEKLGLLELCFSVESASIYHIRSYSRRLNSSISCKNTLSFISKFRFVVSTKLSEVILPSPYTIILLLRYKNGPWVTRISANNHIMIHKSHNTCCPTQHSINPRFVLHSFFSLDEGVFDLNISYFVVCIWKPFFIHWLNLVFLGIFNIWVCISHSASAHSNLRQKWLLFSSSASLASVVVFVQYQTRQNFRQIYFNEVWNQVSDSSMAITHTHHPVVLERRKVAMNNIWILICLLMTRYKSLPRFHWVHLHRSFVSLCFCILILKCDFLSLS